MATIILGITASIAAYKAADIVSLLVKRGHDVHCICTEKALAFVTPLTLMTISRNPVLSSFEDETRDWMPPHIALADKAELFVVAPATADIMAQMACGLAPNLLTSAYLANRAPVLIFPAMNCRMWDHPATQANAATLAARPGHRIVGPAENGILACGAEGKGKLLPVETVVEQIEAAIPGH